MRYVTLFILFFLHLIYVRAESVAQIILQKRAAVTVSPIRLYADSTYSKSTNTTFSEGELFEIIGETKLEHFDNTQNQTFRWYKVKALNGTVGWIFGDNLAVVMLERYVENSLKSFYKKEYNFDNGFEKAIVWVAATEGHDDKYSDKPFLNPAYKEFYLVITNDKGKCTFLNYANVSETGKKDLQSVHFQDVTDDKIDEIVLETSSLPTGRSMDEKALEIYSFKGGTLSKIYEENLSLSWADDVPTPAFSKFVEIEGSIIRVAYVDFKLCESFSLKSVSNEKNVNTEERCMEYVTVSQVWDKKTKTFKPLYPESRSPINAYAREACFVRATPSVSGTIQGNVKPNERLVVVKHFERTIVEKNKKKIETWLFVKHPAGIYGYVLASQLTFKNIEYADLLEQYYKNPPFEKKDWVSDMPFVSVKK
jgi:GW (Gly-Tryp) dipeptide domain